PCASVTAIQSFLFHNAKCVTPTHMQNSVLDLCLRRACTLKMKRSDIVSQQASQDLQSSLNI
ncbi:Hypothetical predicted protein, partial [Pelobates cultripes]